ncbi:MAG: cold shock domain-containing protein, partial [Lachnospiraceae bacterium]|nr:cold shock domain-containing protein [Lachnospiraceae bacterium]
IWVTANEVEYLIYITDSSPAQVDSNGGLVSGYFSYSLFDLTKKDTDEISYGTLLVDFGDEDEDIEDISYSEKSEDDVKTKERTRIMRGTVEVFDKEKGFGSICGEDGKSYFVHRTQINSAKEQKYLKVDDVVEFTPSLGDEAVDVRTAISLDEVKSALRKDGLYTRTKKDVYGNRVWLVIDENGLIQTNEQGMCLEELAEYAGIIA